jgi:hypothetical protein
MKRLAAALLVLLFAGWSPAWAQPAYKCVQGGTVRYSDRPCESAGSKAVGTVVPSTTARPDAQGGAPSHWRYLSAACRQQAESLQRLQEQLASGETAELYQRLATLQEHYDARCQEEEYRARERAAQLLRAETEQRHAEQEAQRREAEQCIEMRRILDARRAQLATMSAGERADLKRFEANFAARCQRAAQR